MAVESDENTRPFADLPGRQFNCRPIELAAQLSVATPEPAPEVAPATGEAAAVNYGLMDSLREGQSNITQVMQDFVKKTGSWQLRHPDWVALQGQPDTR
jgi:hypothetical protein